MYRIMGIFLLVNLAGLVAANKHNPCCSFPCGNKGVCNTAGTSQNTAAAYTCDCYRTGYYGKNCETPYIGTRWSLFVKSLEITKFIAESPKIGYIVNNIESLRRMFVKSLLKSLAFDPPSPEKFNHYADYATWDGYKNDSYYKRLMQPVPKNCPTPMGVAGPKVLPDCEAVMREVFSRDKFIATKDETNILLPTFGQWFTHNVFKTDLKDGRKTWGKQFLDFEHLYGQNIAEQKLLRTMEDGKMKTSIINGEVYPPLLKDIPELASRKGQVSSESTEFQFALAQPFFSTFPSLAFWSTLYIREHNRVCDVLKKEHPEWDDERLYQTTRLILTAVNLGVVIGDYTQKISNSHIQGSYSPDLLHDEPIAWGAGRIHSEFVTLYHFHQGVPDQFIINGNAYPLNQTINNHEVLPKVGMKNFVESLAKQTAGTFTCARNLNKYFIKVWAKRLETERELRTPSFNQFRKYFGFAPHTTFEQLTDNPKALEALKRLYDNDIDAVEYFVGLFVEKVVPNKLFGETLARAVYHFAFRKIFSNIIGSPEYYRPSTFGGEVGFNIVKTTRLRDLLCRNIKGCPDVSFKVTKNQDGNKDKKNEL